MTRAKMRCVEARKVVNGGGYGLPSGLADAIYLTFNAVMGKENAEWAKFTPSGLLNMQITNPALLDVFVVGQDYFIDISPAE
jgi:hypothetical protein